MAKRSPVDFIHGKPVDNAAVLIQLLDRCRGGPQNILGMIVHRNWKQTSIRLPLRLGS